jgi:uncharacterized protein YdhG (YjbR/CyaY superfamily)
MIGSVNQPASMSKNVDEYIFAAFKEHVGVYPTPSGIEALRNELAPYVAGKRSRREAP